jgi:hypothetical protein
MKIEGLTDEYEDDQEIDNNRVSNLLTIEAELLNSAPKLIPVRTADIYMRSQDMLNS